MHQRSPEALRARPVETVLMIVLLLGSTAVYAEFDATGWKWSAPIETDPQRAGFVRLEITPEVVDKSQLSLRDLRVLDEKGELAPHLVHFEKSGSELVWKRVSLTNRLYREGEYARAVLNFAERVIRNRIRVGLGGGDYRRYALLEGSDDGITWGTVDAMWMFQIHDGGEVYKTDTFRFSNNNFPYMRLSVFNMDDEGGRVRIDFVDTAYNRSVQLPTETVLVTVESVEATEEEGNVTIFDIDLRYKHLPVESIELAASDRFFSRRYELSGRDSAEETVRRRTETGWDDQERDVPWKHIKRGVVYRIDRDGETREELTINAIRPSYRYFRLRILNGDDKPLKIEKRGFVVSRRPLGTVVYDQEPTKSYTLLYGNASAVAAQYDLAKAFDNLGERDLPGVTLAVSDALAEIPQRLAWNEKYSWVIWIVLLSAVGLMIALIARNMSRLTPEE